MDCSFKIILNNDIIVLRTYSAFHFNILPRALITLSQSCDSWIPFIAILQVWK